MLNRGTVIAVPFTPPAQSGAVKQARAWWVGGTLLLLLPMLFQNFSYMIDVEPLYLLSKVWPVVMLPLTLYGLCFLRLPHTSLYVLLLAYTLGVTPLISTVTLSNSLTEAFVTTNKIWPFTYYFATAALLHALRPTPAQVRGALLSLAGATFAAFWLLWLFVPASAYHSDPLLSQVFYLESERGYRIVLPVGFALIGLFYNARRVGEPGQLWRAAVILMGLATLVIIYKQRTAIGACLLVMLGIMAQRLPARIRQFGMAALAVAGVLVVLAQAGEVATSLGASLSIRQQSASLAFDYLQASPLRWLFGVGSTTALSRVTLQDILGSRFFYLADIGWLGVVFEYGLIGAVLIACFVLTGVRMAWGAGRDGGPWLEALGDYALYLLLTSAVYSVVYTPGEMATVTALALYGARSRFTGRSSTIAR